MKMDADGATDHGSAGNRPEPGPGVPDSILAPLPSLSTTGKHAKPKVRQVILTHKLDAKHCITVNLIALGQIILGPQRKRFANTGGS